VTEAQPAPPLRRRRSIFPGLLLIVLGLIFLLHRWDPALGIGHLARIYWPLLIVLWGVAKLIDHFIAERTGQLRAPLLSPGEAVLLIILAFVLIVFGMRDFVHERAPWLHIDVPALHDQYSRSRAIAPQSIPADAHVTIETGRGHITVHGSSGSDLRATANESANGENESEADERMNSVQVVVEKTTNGYSVHPIHQSDFSQIVGVDLEVELPKTATVTLRTPHGDIAVSSIAGSIDARTENGDIEIHDAGGDVTAQLEKGDVRIDSVAGNVMLKGRGDDVEIADVKGNVTLDGPFVGSTVVRKVAGTTHIASPWADLSIAQLTGRLEMDSGDLDVSDVGGSARLQTHNKDIDAENIGGQLDIGNSHGDIKVVCAVPPREAINIKNESGDVELTLPGKSSFQIAAYSRSGEATSEFESPSLRTTGEQRDGKLEGQFGGNPGTSAPTITVNTTYGTISLHKAS
jgi:DUF4097 and DUF4098 domain-containing protein YvlB